MRAAAWFRARDFTSRHANKIWLALLAVASVAALMGIRWEATERERQICEGLRSGQRADRLLIDTVLETPTQGIPLLDVESFAGLPPAVQIYVRDLAATASAPEGSSLAERLAAHRDEELGADDLPDFCLAE